MRKALGLRWAVLTVVATALLVVVAACGAAETKVVEVIKEVPVEKQVIKEVIVEKEVVVEKVVVKEVPVEKVVVREKEVVVVATPLPPGEAPWMINLREPQTKFGGSLIHGTHGPSSHFDLYVSGSISNVGPQAPMYDTLVRIDPKHPVPPVVGDLAYRWDISSDGMKYTFNIREGVKFSDGTDLTSADVLASLTRIMFPETYQKGLLAGRAVYFRGGVKEITAPDDFTIQLTLAQSRSSQYILGNLANGFNVITTKEVLDANEGDLKKVATYPGTGPYQHLSRDSEKWVQEANPNYWNPNAGFLDRLTHVWLRAFSAPLSAALEGRALDFADYLAPGGYKAVSGRADGGGMKVYSGSINTMAFNNGKAPTDDVRVREAFALAMDAPAIKEMLMHIKLFQRTGWFDIGTPLARTPAELDKIPGFRSPTSDDIARAKQLLIDAGYPGCKGMPVLEMPIRDLPDRHLIVPAVQAMLKQNLGCESKTSVHQTSAIAEVIREGKFHVILRNFGSGGVPGSGGGAVVLKCDEPNNKGGIRYCNREFDKVVDAYLVESDPNKALDMKRQFRDFFDADWPYMPYAEFPNLYAWYDYVKGFPTFNVTTYEKNMHKLDWVWTTRK
jgi:ABC-type transport system substrate-binding protein